MSIVSLTPKVLVLIIFLVVDILPKRDKLTILNLVANLRVLKSSSYRSFIK